MESLIKTGDGAALPTVAEDVLDTLLSGSFLPRIQLMTANSAQCKDGSFPINRFALVKGGDNIDIGAQIDLLVCGVRPLAIEMGDESLFVYTPFILGDDGQPKLNAEGKKIKDPDFQRIQEAADAGGGKGNMYGLEFLVWSGDRKTFATLFFGTKTARRDAGAVKSRLGNMVTLGAKKIVTSSYEYFSYSVMDCSTAPSVMPEDEVLQEEIAKFRNPPKKNMEAADETTGRAR